MHNKKRGEQCERGRGWQGQGTTGSGALSCLCSVQKTFVAFTAQAVTVTAFVVRPRVCLSVCVLAMCAKIHSHFGGAQKPHEYFKGYNRRCTA